MDALFVEYNDEALEFRESAKLVTEGFTIFFRPLGPEGPTLLGDGKGFSLSDSLLLPLFGLENSFNLDFSVLSLCSFSGGSLLGSLGETWALLGKAALAAVVATAECPPAAPLC